MSRVAYDDIYELGSDGELGDRMGWLLYDTTLDLDDIEVWIDNRAADGDLDTWDGERDGGGWDVMPCWVRKVPLPDGGSRYQYEDAPARGARACLRVERNNGPRHWCWKHPYEPWQTGFPASDFIDPPLPIMPDGYLCMCADCARDHRERMAAARAEVIRRTEEERG